MSFCFRNLFKIVFLGGVLGSFLGVSFVGASESPQKLKSEKFFVCGIAVDLEIADEPKERTLGLMYRTRLDEEKGMIFVFPYSQPLGFWMKNVPFDIDIGFFTAKGSLDSFHTMKGTTPLMKDAKLPNYSSKGLAQFAVELVAGFFSRLPPAQLKGCRLSPIPQSSGN